MDGSKLFDYTRESCRQACQQRKVPVHIWLLVFIMFYFSKYLEWLVDSSTFFIGVVQPPVRYDCVHEGSEVLSHHTAGSLNHALRPDQ